jgi:hypothetical protein
MLKRTLYALLTFLIGTAAAHALPLDSTPVPGGIAVIRLPDDVNSRSLRYQGRKVLVTRRDGAGYAVIGLSLGTKPGRHHLQGKSDDGRKLSLAFEVEAKRYEEQHITIKDKRKVNPEKRDLERIARERKQIDAALEHWSDRDRVVMEFRKPVEGPTSSPFGLRRFFNEQPRTRHRHRDRQLLLQRQYRADRPRSGPGHHVLPHERHRGQTRHGSGDRRCHRQGRHDRPRHRPAPALGRQPQRCAY